MFGFCLGGTGSKNIASICTKVLAKTTAITENGREREGGKVGVGFSNKRGKRDNNICFAHPWTKFTTS